MHPLLENHLKYFETIHPGQINQYYKFAEEIDQTYSAIINEHYSELSGRIEKLKAANSKLRQLMRSYPDRLYLVKNTGEILRFYGGKNKYFETLSQYILKNNFLQFDNQIIRKRMSLAINLAIAYENVVGFDFYIFDKRSDEKVFYDIRVIPYEEENSFTIAVKNITQEKNIFHNIQKNRDKLQSFMEALPDTVFITDSKGEIIEVVSSKDSLNNLVGFLMEYSDRKNITLRTLNSRSSNLEEISVTIDKEEHWYETRTSCFRDKITNSEYVLWIIRDITKRKQTETQVIEAHEETENLISSISSALICVDNHDIVTRWNHSAKELFGLSQTDVLDQPFMSCGINWNWEDILIRISEARNKKLYTLLDDISFKRPDGTDGILNVAVNPIISTRSKPGYLLVINDVTEVRKKENQYRQTQKLESIGQLAAGIAHEINTPLQYIGDNVFFIKDSFTDFQSFMDIITEYKNDPESQTKEAFADAILEAFETNDIEFLLEEIPEALQSTTTGIDRVIEIVKSMKSFSHMGAEDKSSVDINESLKSTITVSRNEWKYVSELVTEFDEQLPRVKCFQSEVNQVFLNIIVNAAHAITDAGRTKEGKITVGTSFDDDYVIVSIADNGTGIPEHVKARIFDPFFTTKEVGRGTGQGLAISHNVIKEQHGGKIDIQTVPGEGTTFLIYLPRKETK